MEINHATKSDINAIMACITDAQSLLKSCGVDQWQDGYPTSEIISGDIERSESYLLTDNGEVIATVVISFAGEPTYTTIEGHWLNNNSYAVIHRLAVRAAHRNKGIAKSIFDQAEQLCLKNGINDIRVDTHRDNKIMLKLLKQLGYTVCGEITLLSGAKRVALQKELQDNGRL